MLTAWCCTDNKALMKLAGGYSMTPLTSTFFIAADTTRSFSKSETSAFKVMPKALQQRFGSLLLRIRRLPSPQCPSEGFHSEKHARGSFTLLIGVSERCVFPVQGVLPHRCRLGFNAPQTLKPHSTAVRINSLWSIHASIPESSRKTR